MDERWHGESRRMATFLGRFVLPILLLSAALLDWSLISLVDLLVFFAIQITVPRKGNPFRRLYIISWGTIIFSVLTIIAQVIFSIIWTVNGNEWSVADSWWAKLIGFVRVEPWGSRSVIYFVILQLAAVVLAFVQVYGNSNHEDSCWLNLFSAIRHIGYHLRVASCLLLPAVQLVVGISHPSWISLPFFIGSCVGLVDWSLTSNFLGLFRWWRPLLLYACASILVLYIYQLPIELPEIIQVVADFIGLYKITDKSEWPEISSGISLLLFYFMLSSVKCDLEEMDSIMSMDRECLTERLLPSKHSFFIREYRSGVRHTNVLLRGSVFRNFSINVFTYGFPVLLLALAFWSFSFASISAFGLLAYIGYILYAFPSLFWLHRLNGLLLVFILLWAACTYVFNVAFTYLNKDRKDMEIWETIGFWHYPIPGLFLLAQFFLGVLVAIGNLVNNSVFQYFDEGDCPSNNDCQEEDKEDTKVLIIATVAWGLRQCSRAITLALIFLRVMKPGYIHAAYTCFFLVFLLSHTISKNMRQALVLFCAAHFSLLYILRINLISSTLVHSGSLTKYILLQLGVPCHANFRDFIEIGVLLCFCALQNHGLKLLFSLSSIVQCTPHPPFGFSILKAGLNKSVLMSVYASSSSIDCQSVNSSHEILVASYLSQVGQHFLSTYRSYGTYVAFLTILLTLYLVTPNYISFGFLFLLLIWIIGRQLVEKTKRRLWFPLKVYATLVFIFTYSLSISSTFQLWVSKFVHLYPDLGFNPETSLFSNIWESLAVLTVMQLYSYERRKNKYSFAPDPADTSEYGLLGFLRRFLIWHSEKVLSILVFYAALSPISAFGFLYLLGLIVCSTLPKASRIPSKLFLVYTGILVSTEYLFQMWGKLAHMLPGQKLYGLSMFLGFRYFESGFWGLESGLRGKILVIVACTLQYNVFHWLETMPRSLVNKLKWEEPCQLFVSLGHASTSSSTYSREEKTQPADSSLLYTNLHPSFSENTNAASTRKYSFGYIWGSNKESHKWNKKRIIALKKERFEIQKATLKIYVKFWVENLFKLRGLEINMIALLVTSFAVLNVISMFYITCLVACIFLKRRAISKLWPVFVCLFASILILEYFAIWKNSIPWIQSPSNVKVQCHDCWRSSNLYFSYCTKCWFGLVVDDPRMLISYYVVFILSSFKLRSDYFTGFSETNTYLEMKSQRRNALVWRDLSFETKSFWTFLDYFRLYAYCHLLDIVLALILITGTLEYDILHLGYLGFALVFFRMRLEILKKKNKIFKYLRIYNFAVIVLSLAYQSPYLGEFTSGKCDTVDYVYEVIGLYKYDYGFRITSRSALVEIVIFLLVSMQSYMFCSSDFDYVARYLEAEQIGAMVREQEKRAAWKTAQLHHIRKSEEQKHLRNMQVEKMKSEMLNLQIQLNSMNSGANFSTSSPKSEGLRQRRNTTLSMDQFNRVSDSEDNSPINQYDQFDDSFDFPVPITLKKDLHPQEVADYHESPTSQQSESMTMDYMRHSLDIQGENEITEVPLLGSSDFTADKTKNKKVNSKEHPLISAVQLLGDGVSQVQSFGNQAVTNIVSFLNIEPEESDSNNGHSSVEDGAYDETKNKKTAWYYGHLEQTHSVHSASGINAPAASLQIGRIFRYIWSQMRSNNDVVCYCFFILVFLWNFSLMSMVYLAALFLYALCVSSGPSYFFWLIMLIYTEIYILLQYLYQIFIQHCGFYIDNIILQWLGFPNPKQKILSSFVISTLPLFMVYVSTLLQSSITAKDGEWAPVTEFNLLNKRNHFHEERRLNYSWADRLNQFLSPLTNVTKAILRSFSKYWKSLTQGSEAPPYFVQLSMKVDEWPEDGIQPERIESGINYLLILCHREICEARDPSKCHSYSRVRIQSIERSQENSDVALAVLEVVYASPLEGCQTEEWYRSLTPAADVASEILKAQSKGFFEEIEFPYPVVSVIGGGRREVDLYAYIFGADLAVFFLVAMFYQSVIKNINKFIDVYQLEDQFPKEFVFILMILFFLIVVDRIIYLCSFATVKVIFYLFNLVLFTYSVTEYAWNMDASHKRVGGFALRAIYLTKSVSFALQAIQIRYGIPNKSTLYRQFLTCKVTQINYFGFRLYRALPFLYELRCVLDWSCTSTSLTMYDWLKLEDINASLFLVKCDADLNRAGHKQGQKQSKMTKFCSGICLFLVLICVIWAPMLMYSSGNPTNIANLIQDVSVQINIKSAGGRLHLFQTTQCERHSSTEPEFSEHSYNIPYLKTYNLQDIQLICCQADASSLWLVPPVVKNRYIKSLLQDRDDMRFIFTWIFTRERPKGKEEVKSETELSGDNSPSKYEVVDVLNGTRNGIELRNTYPKYFRVTSSGEVRQLEQTVDFVSGNLSLSRDFPPWWSFHVNGSDSFGCDGLTGPMAVVVSEETPQGILGETLSKFSIWGIYITFVLAVGRFIRLQCSDLRMRIPFENLPSCDRLIAICEDIYAARAEGELEVEEVLYWTLVKIYRSPHMLLEYTKPD